jgi:hypothetical protein
MADGVGIKTLCVIGALYGPSESAEAPDRVNVLIATCDPSQTSPAGVCCPPTQGFNLPSDAAPDLMLLS